MPRIKITSPVFMAGVQVHKAGDVKEVDDETAAKAVRRGWGELVQDEQPPAEGKGRKGKRP